MVVTTVPRLFVHGSELGSTGYWSRTWPNILNLVDLPTSARVRTRAKMFVDIAMVEAEQASIAGVRAGQKSRCKKGGFSHSEGLTHSFYTSCTPQLCVKKHFCRLERSSFS